MSDAPTPICDLIEQLLSLGTSPGDIFAIARKTEQSLGATATARGSTPDQRERWRRKKERQRARKGGQSPGDNAEGICLEVSKDTQVKGKKERTSKNVPGDVPPVDDGWPVDFAEQFWIAFPPYRRQAKAKVAAKLARIRAEAKVTWETMFGGVKKFAATNPGDYAPAPMVWLNDGRWDRVYGSNGGGSNAKTSTAGGGVGFSGVAARLRNRIQNGGIDDELQLRPAPEDLQPINRR